MTPIRATVIAGGFTTCTSGLFAATGGADVAGTYLHTCAWIYGAAGVIAVIRRAKRAEWNWGAALNPRTSLSDASGADDEDLVPDLDSGPVLAPPAASVVCESCRRRPPARTLIVNGEPFKVCDSCTPNPPAPTQLVTV